MTTAEALDRLAHAKAAGQELRLVDSDQHRWGISVLRDGSFSGWFDCGCGDLDCGVCEWDSYKTIEGLIENQCLDRRDDWSWEAIDPKRYL